MKKYAKILAEKKILTSYYSSTPDTLGYYLHQLYTDSKVNPTEIDLFIKKNQDNIETLIELQKLTIKELEKLNPQKNRIKNNN